MAALTGPAPAGAERRGSGEPTRVAYLVRSWPRLSQTFVVNEVLALERLGVELVLFGMTDPGERLVQPQVGRVRAGVEYLDRGSPRWARLAGHGRLLRAGPGRYLRGLALALTHPRLVAGYTTSSTLRCFGHAVRVADRLRAAAAAGRPVRHLHAHFAHDPALIGLFTARLTGLPFSLTGHARDVYQLARPALVARAAAADAVVVCCRATAEYLSAVLPPAHRGKLRVLPHGVDLELFHPAPRPTGDPPVIMSVGRLVEKKGFADLLAACRALRADGVAFRCVIYGDGPLRGPLQAQADRLGLQDRVRFAGERRQQDLVAALQSADVFALLPFVTDAGDRDGVPNVLVEAMACGLPVVATATGGVPELVRHGEHGLLAAPHDVAAVAGHLATLLGDPVLRRRLGAAGRQRVQAGYDVRSAAEALARLFAGPTSAPDPAVPGRSR